MLIHSDTELILIHSLFILSHTKHLLNNFHEKCSYENIGIGNAIMKILALEIVPLPYPHQGGCKKVEMVPGATEIHPFYMCATHVCYHLF